MTPMEHLHKAEELLAILNQALDDPNLQNVTDWLPVMVATAQVHATLAGIAQPGYRVVQQPTTPIRRGEFEAGKAS